MITILHTSGMGTHRGSIRRHWDRHVYSARIWTAAGWCAVGCYRTLADARAAIAAIEASLPSERGRKIGPLEVWLAAKPHFGQLVSHFLPRHVRQDHRGYYRIRWQRGRWVASRTRHNDPISAASSEK